MECRRRFWHIIETLENGNKRKKTTAAKNNMQFLHCQTLEERWFKIPVDT